MSKQLINRKSFGLFFALEVENYQLLTCILLYLLKVLLHMEQANCIGPTRICAGVGIQNLLSWLKEQLPWKLFFKGSSSSLTWKSFFSSASWSSSGSWPLVLGNPMCKATVTCSTFFSSFTSKPSFCTPICWSSLKGKNWIVWSCTSCSCWIKE